MKTCPVCSREFPDNVKFCPNDGQTLRAKAASADLVGQVVADRYHIVKKLGEGGMGAVYLGEHVKMGRKSAIKVMASSMVHDPDAISRFNREASNASRISHPNVCQIYDFGETPEGLIYLAMEFIEGRSLTDLIDHEGALPAVRAASILKQSADALQAAHDLGIVHRDLKPDNIMITQGRDGADVVKVVDFGIAKAVAGDETGQKVTKTGLVVGTPEYMSPEQLSGDKLDGRSDIYSLGLVLYRMLTGVLPFQADTAQEVMIKRLTDDPTPLAEARPDIAFPEGMQAVVNRALARSAPERYQNAGEFGRDTAAVVAGQAMPGTRVGPAQPHSAATQLMGAAEVEAATQHVAAKKVGPKPAAGAAPAAKKFPLLPVVGGVGGVGALAVVAVVMMKGSATPSQVAATDTSGQVSGRTPDSSKEAPRPPNRPPDSRKSDGRADPPPDGGKRESTATALPPTPTVSLGDSLAAGISFADNEATWMQARRVLSFVYGHAQANPAQKGEAAYNIATTYGDDTPNVIRWLRNSHNLGFAGAADALRALGQQP